MTERSIVLRLRAEVKDFKRSMNEAAQVSDKMSAQFDKNGQRINTATGRMVRSAEVNREAWSTAGTTMTAFGAAGAAGLALATKAAIDWESAWTGVLKTVDGSADELAALEESLRGMALEKPESAQEIAAVAEAAGQLGVQVDGVAAFTSVMVDLGVATNLSADEAATALARFMNVMGSTVDEVDNIGNVVVALGNNFATTEAETVGFTTYLAAAGRQAGLSEADVLGFSAALSSVGVNAEAGGTAFSKVFTSISDAVKDGSADLDVFAEVAGMTSEQFVRAYEQDAAGAITTFVAGMGEMSAAGESTTSVFSDLGLTDQRLMRAVLSLGSAHGELTDALSLANAEFKDGTALVDEATKRYETAESKLAIAKNAISEAAIEFGSVLLPIVAEAADGIADAAEAFSDLPDPVQQALVGLGAAATAVGLLGGGFLILAPRIMEAAAAFKVLRASTNPVAGSLGKVTGAATTLTIALTATTAAITAFNSENIDTQGAGETAQALLDIASGAKTTDEAFASLLTRGGFSDWFNTNDIDSAARAFERLTDSTEAEKWRDALNHVASFGQSSAASMEQAEEFFSTVDQGLASLAQSGATAEASAVLWRLAADTGATVGELRAQLPEYVDALAAAEVANDSAVASVEDLSSTTQDYNDILQDNIDLTREAAGYALDEWDALTQYADALDAATASLEDNGTTLDATTEAGRANRDALSELATSTWAWIDAGVQAGVESNELTTRMQQGRDEFVLTATQMGLTATEAAALADEMGLIPTDIETAITVTGNETAVSAAERVAAALWNIPTSVGTTISVREIGDGSYRTGDGAVYRAEGGPIFGPGSGTSDSILARVSNGEHVWTAAEVDAAGGHGAVEALRHAALRGYATGGPVMVNPAPAPHVSVSPVIDAISRADLDYLAQRIGESNAAAAASLDHTAFASQSRNVAGSSSQVGRLH